MSVITLEDGTNIHYEVLGSGPWVALTPGERSGREPLRLLALRVAQAGYQVLLYDRRNCGASDVVIARRKAADGTELSEQEIWAEDLNELLSRLNAAPCLVGGTSAGCRVSFLLAIRHPEAVKGLLLWSVTGGAVAAESLGYQYYEQFIEVADQEGMEGVLRTPFFAERVQENPSNRARLLQMDPQEFNAIMRDWRTFFTADKPVLGATEEELRRISVPAVIIAGGDEVHPTAVAEKLHQLLPQSEYHPPVWTPEERAQMMQAPETYQALTVEKITPLLLDFLAKQGVGSGVGAGR